MTTNTGSEAVRRSWLFVAARSPAMWLAAAASGFYGFTLAPSLVWADGARLQTEAITGRSTYLTFPEFDPTTTDGLPFERLGAAAWDHPLWVMVGHAVTQVPGGDPNYRLNLLSAVFAVAALIIMYRIMVWLTDSRFAAFFGAGSLAVSHTFWFHAVTAEVYTLHVLFMVALVLFGLRWAETHDTNLLFAFAFVAGLGGSNHILMGFTAIPVVLYMGASVRDRTRDDTVHRRLVGSWRMKFGLAGTFLVGLAPWWIQFFRMALLFDMRTAAQSALGLPWIAGRFPGPVGTATLTNIVEYLVFLTYQFTPVGVALAMIGIFAIRRRSRLQARLFLSLFFVHAIFSANYVVADRFTFHISSYAVFSIFVAVGLGHLVTLASRTWRTLQLHPVRSELVMGTVAFAILIAMPTALYAAAPRIVRGLGVEDQLAIPNVGVNARDGLRYFLNPNKRGDNSPTEFGRTALREVDQDALIVAAWTDDQEAYVVLRHLQLVESLRPDVHVDLAIFVDGESASDRTATLIESQTGCRPIYIASANADLYPLSPTEIHYDVEPEAMLYRLHPMADMTSTEADCLPVPGPPLSPDELLEQVTHG